MCNREYEFPEEVFEKSVKSLEKSNETRFSRVVKSEAFSGLPKELT